MLLLPVAFPLLLGYAVAAVRSCSRDGGAGPPPWRLSSRLLGDGLLLGLALALLALPFLALANLVAATAAPALRGAVAPFLASWLAGLAGAVLGLLGWGAAAILLVPPVVARYAGSGRPADLFDVPGALRLVRRRFAARNLASAAGVTAWIVAAALAAAGPLVLAGVFYAILVSAHACASLVEDPPAR